MKSPLILVLAVVIGSRALFHHDHTHCHTVYLTTYEPIFEDKCRKEYVIDYKKDFKEDCQTFFDEKCETFYVKVCDKHGYHHHHHECHPVPEERCHPVPRVECEKVPIKVPVQVPHEVCEKVERQGPVSYPDYHCETKKHGCRGLLCGLLGGGDHYYDSYGGGYNEDYYLV